MTGTNIDVLADRAAAVGERALAVLKQIEDNLPALTDERFRSGADGFDLAEIAERNEVPAGLLGNT